MIVAMVLTQPPPPPPPQQKDREASGTPLDFSIVGGWEVGHAVFVAEIKPDSIPLQAGLRVGDQVSTGWNWKGNKPLFNVCLQILEINGTRCDKKELREVGT